MSIPAQDFDVDVGPQAIVFQKCPTDTCNIEKPDLTSPLPSLNIYRPLNKNLLLYFVRQSTVAQLVERFQTGDGREERTNSRLPQWK